MQDKQIAASNYIITLNNDISILTDSFSKYINIMTELKEEYGKYYIDHITKEKKDQTIHLIQVVRYYVNQIYIRLTTIKQEIKINKEDYKKLEETRKTIIDTFVPKIEDLEKYTLLVNQILMNEIIQELLQTSNSIITELYGNKQSEQ